MTTTHPEIGPAVPLRPTPVPPVLSPVPRGRIAAAVLVLDLAALLGASLVAGAAGAPPAVLAGASAAVLALFALAGLYRPRLVASGWAQAGVLTRVWGGLAVAGALAAATLHPGGTAAGAGAWFLFAGLGLTGVMRCGGLRFLIRHRYGTALRGARVIVGTGELARRLADAAREAGFLEPLLVGFVDDAVADPGSLPGPWLGGLDEVERLARDGRVTHVLVAREGLTRGDLVRLGHAWMDCGLQVALASSAFEVMVSRGTGGLLGGIPLVELRSTPQRGPGLALKRILDVTGVLAGSLFVLPVLAAAALAVRLTSPGPVLYRQTRVGRRGRTFTMYKLRTMEVGSDDGNHRRYVRELVNGGGVIVDKDGNRVYKLVDDPRVTRVGRILRRTSIDELPQLWNVLRGDMSLVGPRPCLPYEWDLYRDWQRRRLDVLPGITGLWQVAGRSRVSFEEMVLLDLYYIANWSLGFDLRLLARTVPVVLAGTGGH